MSDVMPVVIAGIASGSAFALLALGLVIIFRSTDTVHFAIGDTGTFAAFVAWSLIGHGLPVFWALLSAVLCAALIGAATEQLLIRPLGHGKYRVFVALVVTIGLGLVLQAAMGVLWGHNARGYPPLLSGTVGIGGIPIASNKLAATGLALVAMAAVASFFAFTRLGVAMRGSAEDPFAARLMGINAGRVARLSWFVGCALAGAAMVFLAAESSLNTSLAQEPLFRAFAGVFLGGMTSMVGAVAGGFAIGVLDNLAGRYVSADFRDTIVFAVIIALLFLRPAGLFGSARYERV